MRASCTAAACAALILAAGSSLALEPIRILSPAPDSVVREQVPIKVPAEAIPRSSPTPGYLMIAIDGHFQAAVARPMVGGVVSYVWDTKATTGITQQAVKDGMHEISVTAVGQNGDPVGNTDREEVFVQNAVRSAPGSVRLRYRFYPGEEHTYVHKVTIRQSDQDAYKSRFVLHLISDDMLPGGAALVRERVDRDSTEADQGQPTPVAIAGQSVSFNILPDGLLLPGRKMLRTGQKPVLAFSVFPPGPVKVNSTWAAPIKLSPMFQNLQGLNLPAEAAKSTLMDFEWQSGVPTARITTKFDGVVQVIDQGTPTLYKAIGTRDTYFDWRAGRLIKVVDDYTLTPTDSGGNVSLSGGAGSSGPGSSYGGRGPGGSGPGAVDSSTMLIKAVTQYQD